MHRLAPAHVDDVRQVEAFNPMASVKDRLALAIIEDAETARHAEAGPDGGRSHLRQHRHRARDGLRRRAIPSSR
jgi:hypothetical protein